MRPDTGADVVPEKTHYPTFSQRDLHAPMRQLTLIVMLLMGLAVSPDRLSARQAGHVFDGVVVREEQAAVAINGEVAWLE